MAKERVPQGEPRNRQISEMLVCQAKALIRELWPDEFDTKPKLTLIQGSKGRAS
ncbi:MAG TPA: hypothetical protein VGG00_02520 [Rhodanobacter sp.]